MIIKKLQHHIVNHCQLACDNCSTRSEFAKASFTDINQFELDIITLSKFMIVHNFHIVGGEPLLHKRVVDYLKILRRYNFGKEVSIATNGQFLYKQPEEFWKLIDRIELTLYPNGGIDNTEVLNLTKSKCEEYNIVLNDRYTTHFKQIYHNNSVSKDEVQRVYDGCEFRKEEISCYYVNNGKFYKCVGPLALPDSKTTDSSILDETSIFNYLNCKIPLSSCEKCLALTGTEFPHRQLKKVIKIDKI